MSTAGFSISFPLYDVPNQSEISMEELESLLTSRYTILQSIETKNNKSDNSSTIGPIIVEYEKKLGWNEAMDNDIISHFVLAAAFCKTDQDRNWFTEQEAKLFLARITYYKVNIDEVLGRLRIPLERVENLSESFMDKVRFAEKLKTNTSVPVFKIPFEYALNFIPTMQYFLYKGFVFISKAELNGLIEVVFKENMIKKLNLIRKNFERVMRDTRMCHLINVFQSRREVEAITHTFTGASENMSLKDIEGSVDKLFPLCMQLTHKHLTANSHLTHSGRLQYGLFLKGTGLTMDESLSFWKNKFSKKVNDDKFNREYGYNIRHNYGKEGKRVDYPPWSCVKVQNLPPPTTNDAHGCPFKTLTDDAMRMLLFHSGMKELDVLKILEKKRNNEYSVILTS